MTMMSCLWSVYLLSPIVLASFDRFLGLGATHSPGVGVVSCISPISSDSGPSQRGGTYPVPRAQAALHANAQLTAVDQSQCVELAV